MSEKRKSGFAERAEQSLEFWKESIVGSFTEEVVQIMDSEGISRADLARALESHPSYVTKVLRGTTNLTVASMAKIARALNREVRVHLAQPDMVTVWSDEVPVLVGSESLKAVTNVIPRSGEITTDVFSTSSKLETVRSYIDMLEHPHPIKVTYGFVSEKEASEEIPPQEPDQGGDNATKPLAA